MNWPLAILGIESTTLTVVVDLLIICAAVLYLALIYWAFQDARRRIEDPTLVGCAVAASLVPFIGTLVYIIVRPDETLQDAQERELELEATKLRLYELESALCPHCDYPIESGFVRCPSCLRKLKDRCKSCSQPLDRAWTICPYCETEVSSSTARGGARRSSRSGSPAPAAGRGARADASERSGSARDSAAPARTGARREGGSGPGGGAKEAPSSPDAGARGRRDQPAGEDRPRSERMSSGTATEVVLDSGSNGSKGDGGGALGDERPVRATPARSARTTEK